jgi:2-hydroxychromene-2-carboxylate isomerase
MIEFFFDCSSPWTYLGFHNVRPLAAELGVEIRWRPSWWAACSTR